MSGIIDATADKVVELSGGRRVLIPREIVSLIPFEDFDDAGLWLPNPCVDCGRDTTPRDGPHEYYMVDADVWATAGMHPCGGALCIACLETRLGRSLARADFTDALCNGFDVLDSERLAARKEAR